MASRRLFLACVQDALRNMAVVDAICAPTPELYTEFRGDAAITELFRGNVNFATWPPSAEEITAMVALGAMKILYFLAQCTREPARTISIRLYAHCFIALTKQGNVSQAFEEKITSAVRDEFAVNIAIDTGSLGIIFRSCLSGVTGANAGNIFGTLHHMLPEHALRFRLTISQAAFHNLTGLTICGQAMRKYPNFNWTEVDRLVPGVIEAFARARVVVAGNPYYGFNNDLGQAKSSLYKALIYVGRELLIKLDGQRSLRSYRGIGNNTPIKNKAQLDDLLAEYIDHYNDPLPAADDANARRPRSRWQLDDNPQIERRVYDFCLTISERIFDSTN